MIEMVKITELEPRTIDEFPCNRYINELDSRRIGIDPGPQTIDVTILQVE